MVDPCSLLTQICELRHKLGHLLPSQGLPGRTIRIMRRHADAAGSILGPACGSGGGDRKIERPFPRSACRWTWTAAALRLQFCQQGCGLLEVGRVKALREPAVALHQ